MTDQKPFYVGLCMAGAVSAGAYTAGVMDFLFEALQEWEDNRHQPGAPSHRVVIPVIGGASAGGMTGIITASAVNNPIEPVRTADRDNFFGEYPKNKFWHTWVDMVDRDMFPHLLNTSDVDDGALVSLFNSSFINQIADRALMVDTSSWIQRPYIDPNLKVFTTLTSLRGITYNVGFRGENNQERDKYFMTQHNDYATFRLNTTEYMGDGWIPLDFKTGKSVRIARDAAMATGAFPVGLRSRRLSRPMAAINDNKWMEEATDNSPVTDDPYDSLNVDGGMINNEPFEKVRDVLINLSHGGPILMDNYDGFNSTVLMIDPFPSLPPSYNDSDKLFHVIGSTLSALVNQARIKQIHMRNAMVSDAAGQYLITPVRSVPRLETGEMVREVGAGAIACGAFEGFSGFFHKEFRMHDYFLGRANCEKFLRDHFTVPENSDNQIVRGYSHLTHEQRARFYARPEAGDTGNYLPIIPVFRPRTGKKYLPVFASGSNWPVREEKEIDRFKGLARARAHSVIMNLDNYDWSTRLLMQIGSRVVLRRKLAGLMMGMIKQSLADHHLLRSDQFKPVGKVTPGKHRTYQKPPLVAKAGAASQV